MRRNCALLLAALLALLVLPVRAAEGAELAVDSRVLTGEEETVTLAVTLTGGTDNCGGGFILWYDSLCLELTELEAGPALDGAVTAANPALGDGVAKLSWASVTPLVGEGVAARATFRVLSREASQVELLNAELLDQSGAALPLRVVNGTVGLEDEPEPSPTPAPETGGEPERPRPWAWTRISTGPSCGIISKGSSADRPLCRQKGGDSRNLTVFEKIRPFLLCFPDRIC